MSLIKISATEARNRFFELIEMVAYKGYPVVVKRNNKELVRITAERKPESDFIDEKKLIEETYGMCAKDTWPYEKDTIVKKEKRANIDW